MMITSTTKPWWGRHVLRLACGVLMLSAGVAAAAPFLKPQEAAELQRAASLRMEYLGHMALTPSAVLPAERMPQVLSASEVQRVQQGLREVEGVPRPAASECQFAPGYQLAFLDAQQRVMGRILICLNCRVYAMAETPEAGPVMRFGRLAPTDPLWAVLRAHYPSLPPN